jgi:chalcone isomerase-like protein
MKRIILSLLLTLAMTAPALAGELVGVTMPDSVSVNGKNLVLNGMGLRRKSIIKVYVAGLYLPEKMKGGKAIIAADTERRMVMHFVRSVGKDKICNAWHEGLENNSPDASEDVKKKFDTLCGYMEDVSEGGTYVFTYVPGTGTQVEVNGKNKGTIGGKDFADALFRCWIGSNPPSEDFKAGLVAG